MTAGRTYPMNFTQKIFDSGEVLMEKGAQWAGWMTE